MSDVPDPELDNCHCCEVEVPETEISNPPGQPQLRYRIDIQPTFLQRMVNDLPHQTVPPGSTEDDATRPLNALSARALDDPSIALLDAWATVADVLTFYQERIANEGYLRTAVERRSVLELARQIGYELSPGVAAFTELAFTVEDAPGAPRNVPVPLGTRVLSVPGPGETPQTFETIEEIVARPEWNAFPARRDDPEEVLPGMTDIFLAGVGLQIQVGDALLFVGGDRLEDFTSANWDLRLVNTVEPDPPNARTRVTWKGGLNTSPAVGGDVPGTTPTQAFVFRKRAHIFGHNAPQFRLLPPDTKESFIADDDDKEDVDEIDDWDDHRLIDEYVYHGGPLDLDTNNPKIGEGTWIALAPSLTGDQPSVPPDTISAFPPVGLRPAPFPLTIGADPPVPGQSVASIPGVEERLCRVRSNPVIMNRAAFAISSVVTRLNIDNQEALAVGQSPRDAEFHVESEPLTLGKRPVLVPVDGLETIPEIPDVTPDVQQPTGNLLAVGLAVLGLQPGQKLALVAKRPNVKVVDENTLSVRTIQYLQSIGVISDESLPTGGTQPSPAPIIAALADLMQPGGDTDGGLHLDEPPGAVEPLSGHTFELLEPLTDGVPVEVSAYQQETVSIPTKMWRLRSRTGAVGEARLPFFAVDTVPAAADGETIAEVRRIEAVYQGTGRMLLQLDTRLKYVYDRGSLVISANVAASTHGEAVRNEVLGNGDPASPNQTFTLKKPPLTYVPSPDTPSGGLSTLGVRVNNILWREVPALFGAPPDDQVYTLRRADDGKVDVIFGDGKQGSRLPSGVSNVVAGYRTGIGLEGQVSARSLTLLATRPLGVRSVVNPLAATGAAPPALIEDARQNAPLVVRTLDRVVSVADVQDFARAFAGVGKAQARLLWSGTTKLVHLTVGGADGLPIPEDSPVLTNLAEALLKNGDPSLIIQTPIDSFDLHRFRLTLQLEIDERFERFRVEDQVRAALLDAFSFANRQFGQPVNESEILRLAQDVQGVLAANVALLADENADDPNLVDQDADELIVQVAHFDEDLQRIVPGELLLINPDHLILEDLAT